MANEFELKKQICEIGRRLYAKGFAAANDGNITVRLQRSCVDPCARRRCSVEGLHEAL